MPQEKSPLHNQVVHTARELGGSTSLVTDEYAVYNIVSAQRANASGVLSQYKLLVKNASDSGFINHEIESILDNFFIIETTIFDILNSFKKKDFKKLPLITRSKGQKTFRLYYLFREFIKKTKGKVNKIDLIDFINEYQKFSPFSIRELNSVPIILRYILVEDFGEMILQSRKTIEDYTNAEKFYFKIAKASKKASWDPAKITFTLANQYTTLPINLGLHLIDKLTQHGPKMRPIIKWIRLNLEKQGGVSTELSKLDEDVRIEQALRISNIVESLHWLNQVRWDAIAEDINIVDASLANDPSGLFTKLSQQTKNQYRNVVVRIAERVSIHEAEVARIALKLASQNVQNAELVKVKKHIGYYLIDNEGKEILERELRYTPTRVEKIYNLVLKHPARAYFGILFVFSFIILSFALYLLGLPNHILITDFIWVILFGMVAIEIGIHATNIILTRVLPVRRLPRLDLSYDVGSDKKTFVAIPCMLRSEKSLIELVSKLEIKYVGNSQKNIYYALLLDFSDARQEVLSTDQNLIDLTQRYVQDLNNKYCKNSEKIFFVLIRKRIWNEFEGAFMSWERKRGKLREFNNLLRGKSSSYIVTSGAELLKDIKYVITLDEDTELTHDTARKLIGTISHPLNMPVLNRFGKVIRGYGIIQPRVGVRIATAARSVFSRLYSSVSGIDSYSGPVSDVYQDLFDNAMFFGKGIYDIDAVETSMKGKIPDNTVLSHDLLEGIYARTGFASDIVFFDGFPKYYHEFIVRLERWIRGDWQIIGWLSGHFGQKKYGVPIEKFAIIDRFKIFDNLRRSLVPVSAVFIIIIGYLTDISLELTSIFVVVALISPYALPFMVSFLHPSKAPLRLKFRKWIDDVLTLIIHGALRVFFLLEQASVSVLAIIRTIGRLYFTRKKLLQWKISQDVGSSFQGKLIEYYRAMRVSVLLSFVFILYVTLGGIFDKWMLAWCLIWIVAPIIGYMISIKTDINNKLKKSDVSFLRGLAYRSTLFFIDNMREKTNWLIPDHVQESPKIIGENKFVTSPTNMGMQIISLISAYDLGFISIARYADRLDNLFISLSKLERYKGHFYNWYDIEKLQQLVPGYISSVDSANLILAFITAESSYKEIALKPIISLSINKGITDALREFHKDLYIFQKKSTRSTRKIVSSIMKNLNLFIQENSDISILNIREYVQHLSHLHKKISHFAQVIHDTSARDPQPVLNEPLSSIHLIINLVEDQMMSLQSLVPYLLRMDKSAELYATSDPVILGLVQAIEKEVFSGVTLQSVCFDIPQTVRSLNFENILSESKLSDDAKNFLMDWYMKLLDDIDNGSNKAKSILNVFDYAMHESNNYIKEADFSFLYNKEKELFHIGYNASFDKLDSACYNFMASESNSVSYVAILKGQAPQKHWFYLSRKLVRSGDRVSLVSWGGSLFEYLTSLIFFTTHKESLLGATSLSAINVHIDHAKKHNTIWGMGESAYSSLDASNRYQYQVFGSAKLGLKRNLDDYLVVSPYVSALSLQLVPKKAVENLRSYMDVDMHGKYGFYDALDYLDHDGKRLKKPVPVKIYYAHHLGFTISSIYNVLSDNKLQKLFRTNPIVCSLDVLFEEKMPDTPVAEPLSLPIKIQLPHTSHLRENGMESRRFVPSHSSYPKYNFLSNGNYTLKVSNTGYSTSYYRGVSLTRPSSDTVKGGYGTSFYIKSKDFNSRIIPKDIRSGGKKKVIFQENKVEFLEDNGVFETAVSVSIDPFDPVLVREIDITNKTKEIVSIKLASYGEVSLAYPDQVFHHPHFNHLLVQTEVLPNNSGIIFRRPHPADRTKNLYFAHIITRGVFSNSNIKTATTRSAVYNNSDFDPFCIIDKDINSINPSIPLDPAFSLITGLDIKSGESSVLTFVEITTESYDEMKRLIKKYSISRLARSINTHAITTSADLTRKIGISQEQSVLFQEIASLVFVGINKNSVDIKIDREAVIHSLWKMGISGDFPIALFSIHDIGDVPIVRQVIQCYMYWKHKGIDIDIVILNNQPSSYMKVLDDEVDFLIRQVRESVNNWSKCTIYQVKSDLVSSVDRDVLIDVSRFIYDTKQGQLTDIVKIKSKETEHTDIDKLKIITKKSFTDKSNLVKISNTKNSLLYYNSFGGFDEKTGEYLLSISTNNMPPRPWSHIIAHEKFGTILTVTGSTYTWSIDSYDNRLTSLSNDLLNYRSGEIIYIRDCSNGIFWNPTPYPVKTGAQFDIRYGFGYASYEQSYEGIKSNLTVFVPENGSTKVSLLNLKNATNLERKLTVYTYVSPVMGAMRNHTSDHINFLFNKEKSALFFKNEFSNQMSGRTGFVSFGNVTNTDTTANNSSCTTNINEFIGIDGSYENPYAMKLNSLSNSVKRSSNSCGVIAINIILAPGEDKTIPILVGDALSFVKAEQENESWSNTKTCQNALEFVKQKWSRELSVVNIKSSDKSIDLLTNGWLLYQSVTSRLYAKTGFYQPSGAYGFRDQLQDITSLLWSNPDAVRNFILKACAHQFVEGDSQTWWHEHNMFGMRTVLSDHQLWLAHVVYEYIDATNELGILDEKVNFIEGPQLSFDGRSEWVGIPTVSKESGTVQEHIVRAIKRSFVFGEHGLPLMGYSDWNDGLSSVGREGKGESVWLAWFMVRLLDRSIKYFEQQNDKVSLELFINTRRNIKNALDKHAWDGKWYRRAYFDNGTPLGSKSLKEFKIDSIAQSWSVFSSAMNREKSLIAHKSMVKYLLKKDYFALIDPPLSTNIVQPGYIHDYPPGIRENGAQYNHAAIWAIQSFSEIGDIEYSSRILDLVNPIMHSETALKAKKYGLEPYVVASDIYGGSRASEGGWSWYTGSAGLLYRTIIENIYGIKRYGDTLSIVPKFPFHWKNPSIIIKKGNSVYEIKFDTTVGVSVIDSCSVDKQIVQQNKVPFIDDGKTHIVQVVLKN